MKKLSIVLLVAISFGYATDVKKCFEYNPNDFKLEIDSYNSNDNGKTETVKLDALRVYFFENNESVNPTIEYKVNGRSFYNIYTYCDSNKNGLTCSIECDGGAFDVDKNYNIRTGRLAIYRDDPDTDNGTEKTLYSKDFKKFSKAKEIKCPDNIPTAEPLDENYYKDHPKGKYVCYDFKYKSKYEGCMRSVKSCKFIHRQHFGHYLSTKDSKKALERCKSSKPNLNYVDNVNGLYVCYDYRDFQGEYSGCFRSKKSCKTLHKEHFGKYPNKVASKKALFRCINSIPKKVR